MHEQIRANKRRALLLMAAMAVLMVAVGYALAETIQPGAGIFGVVLALLIWTIHSMVAYFAGDRILLSISGARKIEKKDHPVLFNIVEEMCVASGLAKQPEVYIIDDEALNAFATGRDPSRASVAVTAGLLKELDRDELQGVVGHEISHVNNRDVLYMTMLGVMMGTIIFLAEIGRRMMRFGGVTRTGGRRSKNAGGAAAILFIVAILLMILAPFIAQVLYMAVSRKREYLADASSALYTRFPEGLARALEKLGHSSKKLMSASPAIAPMYIVNPMRVTSRGLSDRSSTHPPISERIRILRSMGGGAAFPSYNDAYRKVTGRPVGVIAFAAAQASGNVPARSAALPIPVVTSPLEHIERVRSTTDLLWVLNDYSIIECPCGTRLKIPPAYGGKKIACPHCSRVHVAQRPAA